MHQCEFRNICTLALGGLNTRIFRRPLPPHSSLIIRVRSKSPEKQVRNMAYIPACIPPTFPPDHFLAGEWFAWRFKQSGDPTTALAQGERSLFVLFALFAPLGFQQVQSKIFQPETQLIQRSVTLYSYVGAADGLRGPGPFQPSPTCTCGRP